MHIQAARHHNKRADAAITLLQDSTALVGTQDANTRSLNLDQGASTILNTVTGIPLVIDGTTTLTQVIATPTPSPTPVSSSDDTSPTEGPTSSASHGPSLTTVVAACVGAFIGAAILIVSAVYLYKRYTSSQERAMRRRRAARVAEQQHNEKQQRPNGSGNLPKSPGAPQIGDLGMGEKIDLSQPSPSLHSDFSHAGSAEAALAAKFTASQQNLALPSSRSPPTRQDTSWSAHSGTATDDSFLSLRSVSAPSSVAKTTPLATVYDHMHHAESAAVVVDPFQDESAELERAYGGPQVPVAAMTKAPRNGSGSSQSNPFADVHAAKARAMGHRPHVNVSAATTQSAYSTHSGSAAGSVSSNPEQAMQNLIAALDLPPAQVEERLRVASMQPSIMSDITTGYEEIDAESFPLPPSSNGHHA